MACLTLFLRHGLSDDDLCDYLYTGDTCDVCMTHFADRKCGFCPKLNKCFSFENKSRCEGDFLYGPQARCTDTHEAPIPVEQPLKVIPIYKGDCGLYKSCDDCTGHYTLAECGWCETTQKCVKLNYSDPDQCPFHSFYIGDNAVCGKKITPTPRPYPRTEVNASLCRSLSGTWCSKCVSTNETYQCGWCFDTSECIVGTETGPLFMKCKDWAFEDNAKCKGVTTSSNVIAVRVVFSLLIAGFMAGGIFICYRAIKTPAVAPQYNPIDTQ